MLHYANNVKYWPKWGQSRKLRIFLLFYSTRYRVRKWHGDLALNLLVHFII
jgi:hypothetical protein